MHVLRSTPPAASPILDDWLLSAIEGSAPPVLTEADRRYACFMDGLLTAVALAPTRSRPHQWLDLMVDRSRVIQGSELEHRLLMSLTLSYNMIVTDMMRGRDEYEPRLFEHIDETGEELHPRLANEWAQGFRCGMQLAPDAWRALAESRQTGSLLVPWATLLLQPDGTSVLLTELDPQQRQDAFRRAIVDLPVANLKIRDHFTRGRNKPTQFVELGEKIGRNDPCTCRSGLKWKKCCGR